MLDRRAAHQPSSIFERLETRLADLGVDWRWGGEHDEVLHAPEGQYFQIVVDPITGERASSLWLPRKDFKSQAHQAQEILRILDLGFTTEQYRGGAPSGTPMAEPLILARRIRSLRSSTYNNPHYYEHRYDRYYTRKVVEDGQEIEERIVVRPVDSVTVEWLGRILRAEEPAPSYREEVGSVGAGDMLYSLECRFPDGRDLSVAVYTSCDPEHSPGAYVLYEFWQGDDTIESETHEPDKINDEEFYFWLGKTKYTLKIVMED